MNHWLRTPALRITLLTSFVYSGNSTLNNTLKYLANDLVAYKANVENKSVPIIYILNLKNKWKWKLTPVFYLHSMWAYAQWPYEGYYGKPKNEPIKITKVNNHAGIAHLIDFRVDRFLSLRFFLQRSKF